MLEKNVLLAGQVGISGHLTIHDNAVVYAQSGVGGDVAAGRDHQRFARVRSAGMAARDHRVSKIAGTSEGGATIGETSQPLHGRACKTLTCRDIKIMKRHLPLAYRNHEFLDGPEAPVHAHPQRISVSAVAFSKRAGSRYGGLFRLGAAYGRWVRWDAITTRRGSWRAAHGVVRRTSRSTRRFVVCSGGGPGIMEAANRGASDAGGKTVGLNIGLPFEQRPNPFVTPELNFEFHYFFMRKFWFAYLAKALVVFPGGFGTLDELTEILTLVQTQKLMKKMVVILYGTTFWKEVINFDALVRHGMIGEDDLNLFQFADDVDTAFQLLEAGLTRYYLEDEQDLPGIAKSQV